MTDIFRGLIEAIMSSASSVGDFFNNMTIQDFGVIAAVFSVAGLLVLLAIKIAQFVNPL